MNSFSTILGCDDAFLLIQEISYGFILALVVVKVAPDLMYCSRLIEDVQGNASWAFWVV